MEVKAKCATIIKKSLLGKNLHCYVTNTAYRYVLLNPIDDGGVEIPPSSYEEVIFAIIRLENNKAAGPDDLLADFKI